MATLQSFVLLAVSIPQSGFWLFRPRLLIDAKRDVRGFNPSIGILVVQTVLVGAQHIALRLFQSLNRDSGCSDFTVARSISDLR